MKTSELVAIGMACGTLITLMALMVSCEKHADSETTRRQYVAKTNTVLRHHQLLSDTERPLE